MMEFKSQIGTARDNKKSPVHNWYKFTAGFSYKFVKKIMEKENLTKENSIFDPFAGCGTTLVSAQKQGVPAKGYEAQKFMYEIIKAKINWALDLDEIKYHLNEINKFVTHNSSSFDLKENAHPLLLTLYEDQILAQLYLIKKYISDLENRKYYFFKLALSQTLHKVANHPIAVPYIVRSRELKNSDPTLDVFTSITEKMLRELEELVDKKNTSKIYYHDARKENRYVEESSFDICITSPPYLNNLDYGEVSKVHTHFFGSTDSWNDITNKVRKKLVTASTTHYSNRKFRKEDWKKREFFQENKEVGRRLLKYSKLLKNAKDEKKTRSKSYDIMILYYFEDMFKVLKEVRRVLKSEKRAYIILGDSAPYGTYIPTTKILGEICKNTGFKNAKIYELRKRGGKWTTLKYRHSKKLSENILIIE